MTIRICMWSGPRNLSTAMMRSFGARPDTAVFDEPFYAPYLAATGKVHPGSAETLAGHETNPDIVATQCLTAPLSGQSLYFQKHMPQHMHVGFPIRWMENCRHFFLLRNPESVIASFAKGRPEFDSDEVGFWPQVELYDRLIQSGHSVPIIESHDILAEPEGMLTRLCDALDIVFLPEMLSWEAGPRDTDGAWAPYWYKSVASSTGFGPPSHARPVVPERYREMAERCRPAYERLRALKLKP